MIEIKRPTLGVISSPKEDIPLAGFRDALNFRFRQGKISKFPGWRRITVFADVFFRWDCGLWDLGGTWDNIAMFDKFYFDQDCVIYV